MVKVKICTNINDVENGYVLIKCPGCKELHSLNVANDKGRKSCWQFNGDVERPTFSPSLLVRTGHHVTGQPKPPNCKHCEDEEHNPCTCCHSFIKDGNIQFLPDCTHKLAGKTAPLEDF